MDDLKFTIGFIAFAIIFITAVATFTLIAVNNKAEAAEKAQQHCMMKGYDTYDTFRIKIFDSTPYGVRCNYIQNRRELITNSDTIVAVTG